MAPPVAGIVKNYKIYFYKHVYFLASRPNTLFLPFSRKRVYGRLATEIVIFLIKKVEEPEHPIPLDYLGPHGPAAGWEEQRERELAGNFCIQILCIFISSFSFYTPTIRRRGY